MTGPSLSPTARSLSAALVAVSLLLAACSSTEAGQDVFVTETVTSAPSTSAGDPSTSASSTSASSTSAPPATESAPTTVEPPADPSVSDPEDSDTTDSPVPGTDDEGTDDDSGSSETEEPESTTDGTAPTRPMPIDFDPLSLPPDTAADPDASGPEGGRDCASDPSYFDEDPDGLEPNLILAWRAVEAAANADDLVVCLNDGKRSTAQQQATFDEYVELYGEEVARQYVLPPDKSAHVTGNAIDVQPAAASNWLIRSDGSFGLCRIYENELWHFEFDREYAVTGCPALKPNPLQ